MISGNPGSDVPRVNAAVARIASINDLLIKASDRTYHWPLALR
jgi:nuclear transport factor 2 (NTF2) superfamily protein